MIIRRRHTANFTVIGNVLFDDERLDADEIGVLGYLLSRPHDWEVRRPHLRKRFRIGREKLQRIIWGCMKAGWIIAERTRLSNGTFSTVYEVRDEPGPPLSDAEVRTLLTAASAVAIDDENSAEDGDVTDHPPDPGPAEPEPGQPATAQPATANPSWSIKNGLPNTDSTNTDSTKAPPLWREIRAIWPSGEIRSPFVCEKLFAALSPDERQQAFEGVGPYLANCRSKNQKLCDLSTYLKEKRFRGNLAVVATSFAVIGNTPQAFRWLEYRRAMGQRNDFLEACWRAGKSWYAPTEWPPPLPPKPIV